MTDAERVLAAVRRRSAALVGKDVDALLELLHPDFVYVTAGGEVLGRDRYLDLYVRPATVRWVRQDIHDPQVVESEGTAVVTFLVHDVARFADLELDETFRSSSTWVERGQEWQCLGGHTSCLPQ
jgi:uncharacterized protein YchJ